MRTRTRRSSIGALHGRLYTAWLGGVWLPGATMKDSGRTYQSTIIDRLGRNVANPLHSVQMHVTRNSAKVEALKWPTLYRGDVGVSLAELSMSAMDLWTIQDLNAWGTKGAARARVIQPVLDLPVVLGELTEIRQMATGLTSAARHIIRSANGKRDAIRRLRDFLKGVGQLDLYVAFGIFPIVDTVARLKKAYGTNAQMITDIVNVDKKWIHREFTLRKTDKSWEETISNGCFPSSPRTWMWNNKVHVSNRVRDRIWFSTWIRLQLPEGLARPERDELIRKMLYGGGLAQARVLYELAPYSWLADWFQSAGDFLANASDHSLYRWKFACTMHETIHEKSFRGTVGYFFNTTKLSVHPTATVRATVKRREPYLWGKVGVTTANLSAFRAFIAASLAASKLPSN